jgi:hypothetical protein
MIVSASGNINITAEAAQDAGIQSPGALSITAGSDLLLSAIGSGETGQALVTANGDLSIQAGDIFMISSTGGPIVEISTTAGNALLIANDTFSAIANSHVSNFGSGKLTIVVDQQAPFPPAIGSGQFNLLGSEATITAVGELGIFTALPSQNNIVGLINGATLAQGNQVSGVWYSTFAGTSNPPFTIYYKAGEPVVFSVAVLANVQVIQQAMSRIMGWAWVSSYIACYEEGCIKIKSAGPRACPKSREHLVFQRKPFEYPLFLPEYNCPKRPVPRATIDTYRVQF